MKSNEIHNPLVSIVVITYNSAKYVLETLESAKAQTYQNIELIVTDDCSTDDTVAICREWIEKNKERFVRTKLIESEMNTGISVNCNRGYNAAKGEWIKGIAGDDALYPDSINLYMDFVALHPEARIIHARTDCYNDSFSSSTLNKNYFIKYHASFSKGERLDSKRQHNLLCISNSIAAPTVFMQYSLWQEMNGFDERICMCEDWPMWLKITNAKIPFHFIDKATVKYRVTLNSTYGKESVKYLFKRFFEIDNIVYRLYIKHSVAPGFILMNRYDFYLRYFLDWLGLNNKRMFSIVIFFFLSMPYKILRRCFEKIDK